MRLGGNALHLTEVTNRSEVEESVHWAEAQNLPVIMIGEGSNIVWGDSGFPGLVVVNKITRYESYQEDDENTYLTVGGGENWDSVVERTVKEGLSGIEALSLVPGTAGATPVQNVGAYGQEIADSLVSVEAYDKELKSFVTIPKVDCAFGYRTSRFKTTDKGRFFITAITLHLTKTNLQPPFYPALTEYFRQNNITEYTPITVREAVINIRKRKLPDPKVVANNGSFFHNPVVDIDIFTQLRDNFPDLIYWETEDGNYKISAAWLLDKAGFKGVHDQETGMATWEAQPLVLINESAKSTADLLKFKQKIIDTVGDLFGITLTQEPELIGE